MPKSPFLKRLNIFILYTIYCFDIAAIVIVFIIFTPLIIKSTSLFVPETMSLPTRNVVLGLLFAAYPITQFFGAPLLGDLSDHFGRKLILNISTLFTAFTFFLTAVAILMHNLPLLFISRILGGFFAGNASLAQATVSDLIESKKRSTYMALFTVVGGFSWIIGPFIGAVLSNPKIVSWFNFDVPFWFLGLIFLMSWGIVLISMQPDKPDNQTEKLSLIQSFKNLASIFHHRIIVLAFIASGVAMLGWMILNSFTAPYLMEKYHYHEHTIGYVYAYYSVFWLLGGLFAMLWFKKHRSAKLNLYCLFVIPFFLILFVFFDNPYAVLWITPIPTFLMPISVASFMSLFSHLVSSKMQGKVFGGYVGMLALATTIAPAFSGWVSKYGLNVPFMFCSLVLFITFLIYLSWYLKHKKEIKEHKV